MSCLRGEVQTAFVDAQLQRANLAFAQLHNADLMRVQLQEANLAYAQLHKADLTGAQLEGAQCNAAHGLAGRV
jgi:uncharacterized protein YjbI with pentapeptide repeats